MILFFIALVGLVLTFVYLIIGLVKRNSGNFKASGVVFLVTCGAIILVTIAEFLFHDKEKDYADKETILVAMREASLGGIHLRVYVDSTFELGDGVEVSMRGKINVHGDTLFLLKKDTLAKSFVLHGYFLREIENTGIRFLEIETNKILGDH